MSSSSSITFAAVILSVLAFLFASSGLFSPYWLKYNKGIDNQDGYVKYFTGLWQECEELDDSAKDCMKTGNLKGFAAWYVACGTLAMLAFTGSFMAMLYLVIWAYSYRLSSIGKMIIIIVSYTTSVLLAITLLLYGTQAKEDTEDRIIKLINSDTIDSDQLKLSWSYYFSMVGSIQEAITGTVVIFIRPSFYGLRRYPKGYSMGNILDRRRGRGNTYNTRSATHRTNNSYGEMRYGRNNAYGYYDLYSKPSDPLTGQRGSRLPRITSGLYPRGESSMYTPGRKQNGGFSNYDRYSNGRSNGISRYASNGPDHLNDGGSDFLGSQLEIYSKRGRYYTRNGLDPYSARRDLITIPGRQIEVL